MFIVNFWMIIGILDGTSIITQFEVSIETHHGVKLIIKLTLWLCNIAMV